MHKKAAPNYAVSCKGPDRLAPGLAKKPTTKKFEESKMWSNHKIKALNNTFD